MKIFFNWMHRKLHPVVANYSQVPRKREEEDEKIEGVTVEEKEALLLNDMLYGILAIGTLGKFEDPFLSDPLYDNIEEHIQPQQEEEVAAPAVKPVQLVNKKEEDQKVATLIEVEAKLLREDRPLLREVEERERGRTTLADLFAADPMVKEEHKTNKGISMNRLLEVKKKKTQDTIKSCTNSCSSNKNKKLQKLVKRMLKKKIHPENFNVGGKEDVQRSRCVYWTNLEKTVGSGPKYKVGPREWGWTLDSDVGHHMKDSDYYATSATV